MEQVFFVVAVICFILAPVSLALCIVAFVRFDIPNAIRFLQHKPTKGRTAGNAHRLRARGRRGGSKARVSIAGQGDDSTTASVGAGKVASYEDAHHSTNAVAPGKFAFGKKEQGQTTPSEDSERPTGLLDEDSERPTGLLAEDSERPTGLLQDDAERPTGLLGDEDSERPTGLLQDDSEHPTGLLVVDDSERPTGLLAEDESERPTGLLTTEESSNESVVQHEEASFRFTLKHNEIVVHTAELIA